jgi:hypothetical protein
MFLLKVFEFDPTSTEGIPPEHLATFQFPRMKHHQSPLAILTSSFPASNRTIFGDEIPKPCYAATTSGLVCLRILSQDRYTITSCQAFLLPDLLMDAEKEPDGTPSIHPWSTWGECNSRWFKDVGAGLILPTRPYGYRISRPSRVLDFNPYDIARDLCRQEYTPSSAYNSEDEGGCSHIVTESTIILSDDPFEENIVSSLPYRETLYELPEGLNTSSLSLVEEDFYVIEVRALFYYRGISGL